jgi:hypothetical protein
MNALYYNTTGYYNTANGMNALYSNTDGAYNTANGMNALYSNTDGAYNTANGMQALYWNTTGQYNTALWYNAGQNLKSWDNNIAIWYNTNFQNTTASNQLNIWNWIYGSDGNIGIGTTAPATKLEIDNTTANTSGLRFTRLTSTWASSALFSGILGVNSTGDVGIAQLTGNSFTGFTTGQLTFGTATGGLSQSSNLFWDNANGRLGIGTNSPQGSLDIIGWFNLRNTSGVAWSNYGVEFNTNWNAPRIDFVYNNTWVGQFWSDANDFWYRNSKIGTGWHKFFTSAGAGQIERLTIINNGNIGIGTSNPNTKLEINSGLTGTGWLRFTSLLSTSTALSGNGKFLSVNATGDVILTDGSW